MANKIVISTFNITSSIIKLSDNTLGRRYNIDLSTLTNIPTSIPKGAIVIRGSSGWGLLTNNTVNENDLIGVILDDIDNSTSSTSVEADVLTHGKVIKEFLKYYDDSSSQFQSISSFDDLHPRIQAI